MYLYYNGFKIVDSVGSIDEISHNKLNDNVLYKSNLSEIDTNSVIGGRNWIICRTVF